jgi:hypothetical protein
MTESEFSLEASLGSFMPHRMHMRLGGAVGDYSPETAHVHSLATSVHENMHFLQTLMTSYGHMTWDSHRQTTSYLMSEWSRLATAPDGKRRLPLAHAAKLSRGHLLGALVTHRAILEMIRLDRARSWRQEPNVSFAEIGLSLAPHPWACNPVITVGGESHTLQGKEIMEGHSKYVETTLLETIVGMSRKDAWDRSTLPPQYHIALDWFVEQCGEERQSEFPFLCDLALQTNWSILPETEAQWRASHPAWRFVTLTDARRLMPGLTLGDPSEWPMRYSHFASSLLTAAGFQSLDDVYSERLAVIHRKKELLRLDDLMRAAIEFRIKHPWCGGNPVADPQLWKMLASKFPPPIMEIDGQLRGFGLGSAEANGEVVFELQFQALAAQIFGEFSQTAVREQTIECAFSKYDIPLGCEFQRTATCSGRYDPRKGPPHPAMIAENTPGCSFELLLNASGLSSADLDLDHSARLPTDKDLEEMERQARIEKERAEGEM